MPSVEVVYSGLIRAAVPGASESYELGGDATVRDLLDAVARRHGPQARRHLLDEHAQLVSHTRVLVGGYAARDLDARLAADGPVQVVVLAPMMIGG